MKFGQQLELNTFPEWSKSYVRYRQLKNAINALFPTQGELAAEARSDGRKAKAALSKLTNANTTPLQKKDAKAAASGGGTDSRSDGEESIGLLSPSPSSGHLSAAISASPPGSPQPPLRVARRNVESLALNTNTREYGGLEDDPLLADRSSSAGKPPAHFSVQLNDAPVAIAGADAAALPRPDSPVRGDPHIGRTIARRHFATAASMANLRSSNSAEAHLNKVDTIVIKILSELQKVDEFHKNMEAKILHTFESIRRQAEDLLAQRCAAQPKQEGIMKRLRQLRLKAERNGHEEKDSSSPVWTPSSSSTNLAGLPHVHSHPSLHHNGHNGHQSSGGHSSSGGGHHSGSHSRRHSSSHQLDKQQLDKQQLDDSEMDAIPLRGAFIALLRRTTMLIHFVDINSVAFLKLLKVFEKRTSEALRHLDGANATVGTGAGAGAATAAREQTARTIAQLKSSIQARSFYTSRALDNGVLPEVYRLFSDLFEHGNLERGKLVLLSTMTEQQYNRTDAFWLGIKIGVILMLLGLLGVILIRPVENLALVAEMGAFAPIYRLTGLLITLLWLWSFLVYIFDKHRIPYVLIFQLNPRTRLTHFQLQTEAANFTIVYLFNALLFLTHSGSLVFENFTLLMYPLALFLYVIFKFFTPSRLVSNWHSRMVLLGTLGQIVIAPFGKTRFMEAFVADVMTSMVKIFVDVEAAFCIFITWFTHTRLEATISCGGVARVIVPIICALPLWWRFMQCLRRYYDTQKRMPHLPNAFKYLITHSVVIMSAYHPIFLDHHASAWQTYRIVWLLCCVGSTSYQIWWDLVMDWGLLTWSHAKWPLLRAELVFTEHAWFYYFAMVSNFFLRWVWVITIIPFSFEDGEADNWTPTTYFAALVSYDQIIMPVLGALELYRRFQWSILRVEYEQIVQGTHLRVDAHLPVYIQQTQKTTQEKKLEDEEKPYGVVTEVVGMVCLLLTIAVIAAIM